MTEYFFTDGDVYAGLYKILDERLDCYRILKTENGKPYLEGDPLFFSISHSADRGVFAISDRPVGIDLETVRERKFSSVLKKFTDREKGEIKGTEDFLKHWVVREAYIKMKGLTLAEKLSDCEYYGGVLYDCGRAVGCTFTHGSDGNAVWCICVDND